jgi:tetratricopeptide (TPR) repeat protein
LVDWDFEPIPPSHEKLNQKLNQILYPNNYIGRRKEFRAFYNYLYSNTLKKLLLHGEGGIGKTAMVAKFGLELRDEGYRVFDYSLKHGGDFDDFLFDIELELSEANAKKFTRIKERCHDQSCVAKRLARLLLSENPKIAFIFDNLEDVQDSITKELTDQNLKQWIEALGEMDDVVVLLTSRWLLPNCQHAIALNRPLKSDFLYFLSSQNINFSRREKLDKIYQTFGGNYRGVEFFLSAIEQMSSQEEDVFLESISQATDKMREDIAIEKILSYLSQEERGLLEQLSVYSVPVPKEGVVNISLDLPQDSVERLVSFSLVEKSYNPIYEVNEYQISALVLAFIDEQISLSHEVKTQSADYLLWLFLEERKTVAWAMVAYEALKRVDNIGALEEWLFDVKSENDKNLRGVVLNNIAVQNLHLANYSKALEYLERSLEIYVAIGDKSGEGATLNNISQIYDARGDLTKALEYLERSL